jgi:hypothetical protein
MCYKTGTRPDINSGSRPKGVYGQHQKHLVWANGQSREEKKEREKAGTTFVID